MEYTGTESSLPSGRAQLARLIRAAGDVIRIEDAQRSLDLSREDAAKRLARWTKQGWLRRVGSGAYVPASLDSLNSQHVLDDPWVLVPALYGPAYIGGRTAAEHWDLTEQIFNDIVVFTARPIRDRQARHHGALFTLKRIKPENIFGTKCVWRHRTKVEVSDIHRTIVDMLDDPAVGGGIQHVSDCLRAYLVRSDRDDGALLRYGDRLGNGAVFKRLGFLVDGDERASSLASECITRLTKGNAKLDPAIKAKRLITKWRLWIPATWEKAAAR